MKKSFPFLGLASAAACVLSLSAQAQTTYQGNGNTGFGGPAGNGSLTFSDDGTTLTGTITPGPNNGAGNAGEFYDELVIYIDSQAGGLTNTSTLTAAPVTNMDGTISPDVLQQAAAGVESTNTGTERSVVNFAAGFTADYVLALSPANVGFGYLYSFNPDGSLNAISKETFPSSQTGSGAGPKTFSFTLASIGSPTSFQFATTYLNSHETTSMGNVVNNVFRSNEAIGNTLTDISNPGNTFPGQDTVALGSALYNTSLIPEPRTWAMVLAGFATLALFQQRRRHA